MLELFALRIERKPDTLPVDRVYLIRRCDESLLKRIFRHALSFPVDSCIERRLLETAPSNFLDRTIDPYADARPFTKAEWEQLLRSSPWAMAIPVRNRSRPGQAPPPPFCDGPYARILDGASGPLCIACQRDCVAAPRLFLASLLERLEVRAPASREKGPPLLVDDWSCASQLETTAPFLWVLAKSRGPYARSFKVKRAGGGSRTIYPHPPKMRRIGEHLRLRLLRPLCRDLGSHVGAYQPGKSPVDVAKEHVYACPVCEKADGPHTCEMALTSTVDGYRIARTSQDNCAACQPVPPHTCSRRGVKVRLQLRDLFRSTRSANVRRYLREVAGYSPRVCHLLARLMTVPMRDPRKKAKYRGVPQGFITSGDLCNLVADRLIDQPLLAALPGWRYTRTVDTLYFSHPDNLPSPAVDALIAKVVEVARRSHYRVHTKTVHVQRPNRQQKVCGVVINQRVNVPRTEYRNLNALLHNCVKQGFEAQLKRSRKTTLRELHDWIRGALARMDQVAPHKARRLRLVYEHACATQEATGTPAQLTD